MKTSVSLIANITDCVARRARKLSIPTIVALLVFFPLLDLADAAAGDLDLTFGNGGEVVTDFFGNFDSVNGLAVQQDGKIVAVGAMTAPNTGSDFALARYNSDGSLDPTFGSGGKVNTDFSGSSNVLLDVVIQPDGKLLTSGIAGFDFALARYNSDGSLDTTFGSGGLVRTSFPDGTAAAARIAIQPGGKIVVAGTSAVFLTNKERIALARYNSDGSLDTTFGSGGRVITGLSVDLRAGDMIIVTGGKIVVGGGTFNGPEASDFTLVRYNIDGDLDATFGSGGMVFTDFFGVFDFCLSLRAQPDGKLVASGNAQSPFFGSTLGIARYNADGSLDPTFGVGGKSNEIVRVASRGMAILADGKIIAGGIGFDASTGADFDFSVVRYNSDGSLDTTFGSGGRSSTDFSGTTAQVNDLALQADGKVVLGGAVVEAQNFDFALARFLGDGPGFDICIQDDGDGSTFQFNSTTGDYQFANCLGLTTAGTGSVTQKGSTISLKHNTSDRRVLVKISRSANTATATIQLLSQGITFTITDRNTANNTCACP